MSLPGLAIIIMLVSLVLGWVFSKIAYLCSGGWETLFQVIMAFCFTISLIIAAGLVVMGGLGIFAHYGFI